MYGFPILMMYPETLLNFEAVLEHAGRSEGHQDDTRGREARSPEEQDELND